MFLKDKKRIHNIILKLINITQLNYIIAKISSQNKRSENIAIAESKSKQLYGN